MDSKVRASAKNTISAFMMQMVIMVIGIVLPRLYLKAYGSEINGLVTSINQFVSYFAIVEAGLSSVAIQSLFVPIARNDERRINNILAAVKKFYYNVGFIFGGLVAGFSLLYPLFIAVDGWSYWDIVILVLVLGAHGAIDFFTLSKYRVLLTADQRYYVVANATTIAYIVNFVVVYVAIEMSLGITVVRALALTLFIVKSLIVNIYAKKHYKFVQSKAEPDTVALNKRWDAMLLQLLGLAQTALPVVLLTVFSDDLKLISVYTVYNLVAYSILSILRIATNGVGGTLGNVIASGNEDELKGFYRAYETLFLSITSVAYACMYALYIPFIKLYTAGINDCEYIYPIIAVLFTLNGLTYSISVPAESLIGTAGVYSETKSLTIIQTVIAVVLSTALVPFFGISGILVGLIVSNLYRDIFLVAYMARNVIKISVFDSFKRIGIALLSFAAACLPFVFFEIEASGYLVWAAKAIVVAIWSVIITLVFNIILNKKSTADAIRSISRKIKRRK